MVYEKYGEAVVAGAKADAAGGEVKPTVAMVEVMVGKRRAREIREVWMEINKKKGDGMR